MNTLEANSKDDTLPQQTLEAVAKTIYRQAQEYGFNRKDFIRFVNLLLDMGLERSGVYTPPPSQEITSLENGRSRQNDREVSVRLYEKSDFAMLKEWVSDPVGKKFLTTRTDLSRHCTLEELVESETSVFGIVSLDEKPIGALAYLNIDREQKKAELRKLIGDPAARGQGYARRAGQYWIEYGVSTLGLRKIYVNTLETNLANIRLNEMLGFRVEGLLRDEILIDGQYQDVLRMSLVLP